MIPEAYVIEWQQKYPWQEEAQVEQDLILSRMVVDIFSSEKTKETCLFRGGTALYKTILRAPVRYSEDLDLVMVDKGPIGPIYDAIREVLDPVFGEPARDQGRFIATMTYSYPSEFPRPSERKIKIEFNYQDDFIVFDREWKTFKMDNTWYSGEVRLPTYTLDELLGTKLRALFQRRQGRDLFDLWFAMTEKEFDRDRVLTSFSRYTKHLDTPIIRARYEKNLSEKLLNENFRSDLQPLLVSGVEYDVDRAGNLVHQEFIQHLKGDPYKGDNNIFGDD